jgi:hypothetical protein
MELILQTELPIKTVSEANCSEHWTKKHKRHISQKEMVSWFFKPLRSQIFLPCHIKLIRISPRRLDKDDNLPCSFKWIKDEIAAQLTGYLTPGRADEDPRITWSYDQEKGTPQRIRLEIYQ